MDIDPSLAAHAKLAFASMCGGIVRLLFRPAASMLKTLWLLFGCMTCGFFGTTPALAFWQLGPEYAGAIGALLGFIGLSLAEGLLKAVDGFDFRVILSKFFGTRA